MEICDGLQYVEPDTGEVVTFQEEDDPGFQTDDEREESYERCVEEYEDYFGKMIISSAILSLLVVIHFNIVTFTYWRQAVDEDESGSYQHGIDLDDEGQKLLEN